MNAQYATFKRPIDNTVPVNGRRVSLGTWVTAWAIGGVPVGLIGGGLYLLAVYKGWL